jgi:hypothetical protein
VQPDIKKELLTAAENAKSNEDTEFLTVTTANGVSPRFQRQDTRPTAVRPGQKLISARFTSQTACDPMSIPAPDKPK